MGVTDWPDKSPKSLDVDFESDTTAVTANRKTSENTQFNHEGTLLLLDLYQKDLEKFRNKNIKKKHLWEEIAQKLNEHGYNFTGADCDRKWRGRVGIESHLPHLMRVLNL